MGELKKVARVFRAPNSPLNVRPIDASTRRISEHLVRLVQILFGVVVAQSLVLYRDVVTSPFHHDTVGAALALFSIYVMIVWSWIDWNTTMELRPYDLRRQSPRLVEHTERFRLYSDITIIVLYAYILFQVDVLAGDSEADIRYLLLGYPMVFALYFASGAFRVIRHGRRASNLRLIVIYLGWFAAFLPAYVLLRRTDVSDFGLNCLTLSLTVVVMRVYRWHRRRQRPFPSVGVDLDGGGCPARRGFSAAVPV